MDSGCNASFCVISRPEKDWKSSNRLFRKLRVSITESCNFHCLYCRDSQSVLASNPTSILRADQIAGICKKLCECGIEDIRLTGGEPTVRRDLVDIVIKLSELPIRKLGLTTNGLLLRPLLPYLLDSRCRHINFSLDSLNPERFRTITGLNKLTETVTAILTAHEKGFHVKVNMVLLKGINDGEIFDFIEFSILHGIEVRFLELMNIGLMLEKRQYFVKAQEIIDRIQSRYRLLPRANAPDSTSVNYTTESGAQIGFIASESKPFCSTCTRLRLSAQGNLRSCLMDDREVTVMGVKSEQYEGILDEMLMSKPLSGMRNQKLTMCSIGG